MHVFFGMLVYCSLKRTILKTEISSVLKLGKDLMCNHVDNQHLSCIMKPL